MQSDPVPDIHEAAGTEICHELSAPRAATQRGHALRGRGCGFLQSLAAAMKKQGGRRNENVPASDPESPNLSTPLACSFSTNAPSSPAKGPCTKLLRFYYLLPAAQIQNTSGQTNTQSALARSLPPAAGSGSARAPVGWGREPGKSAEVVC